MDSSTELVSTCICWLICSLGVAINYPRGHGQLPQFLWASIFFPLKIRVWTKYLKIDLRPIEPQEHNSSLWELPCELHPAMPWGWRHLSMSGSQDTHSSGSKRWDFHLSRPRRQSIELKKIILKLLCYLSCWVLDLLGTCHPFVFLFLPFWIEVVNLCLYHHCTLEAYNMFDFSGSELESSLLQDELYFESYSYLTDI